MHQLVRFVDLVVLVYDISGTGSECRWNVGLYVMSHVTFLVLSIVLIEVSNTTQSSKYYVTSYST